MLPNLGFADTIILYPLYYKKEGGFVHTNTIFNVANYILTKQGSMTAMKLQKLCYYSQAYSLAWNGKPLFDDDFEAWANGPVCKDLFYSHKGEFVLPKNKYKGSPWDFSSDEIETIDMVLDAYKDSTPNELSALSHTERPWKEARKGFAPGESCSVIISKDTM